MIGVFDSGVGGLSVLKELRTELPREDFIYIADSAHAPYGERTEADVLARSRALTRYLVSESARAVVVACNTATAAAINALRADYPLLSIIGVEPALKPATLASRTRRIGVMATRGTLASARFQALLSAQPDGFEFVLQPCDGLADAIERGAAPLSTNEVAAAVNDIQRACEQHTRLMGRFGAESGAIDTLVLGCTHYPFAADVLRGLLGPSVQLIATGAAVARQTQLRLAALQIDAATDHAECAPGRVCLLATAFPLRLEAAAFQWLQLDEKVGLLSI